MFQMRQFAVASQSGGKGSEKELVIAEDKSFLEVAVIRGMICELLCSVVVRAPFISVVYTV